MPDWELLECDVQSLSFIPLVCKSVCVFSVKVYKWLVLLYYRCARTHTCSQNQGSHWPISSQSSVTLRDKHYYNIYDSFSQAAICRKNWTNVRETTADVAQKSLMDRNEMGGYSLGNAAHQIKIHLVQEQMFQIF